MAPAIEGYDILSPLGEGGMGTVWRAVQLSTRREVALKVMGMGTFGSDRARERFDREVELTAQLEHAHIARVYDSGLRQGVYFYAMELIQGEPLDRYISGRGWTPWIAGSHGRRPVLELLRTVSLAVHHAHQRGIIHRDLKPSNILVSPDGQPHVVDFGLAKALPGPGTLPAGSTPVSLDGQIAGTPAYMSPEQARGRDTALDVRSDVYSLGVILYHALLGRFPHDVSGPYLDVLRRVSEEEVLRPRQVVPDLDRELEALLLKALAHDADARYGTASALAADIDNYLGGEPLQAKPATIAYFLRKRLRKHRPRVAAAAVVLLVLAGMAVFAFVRIAHERTIAEQNAAAANQQRNAALASEARALREQERADAQSRAAETELASSLVAQGNALGAADRWAESVDLYLRARDVLAKLGLPTAAADAGLWDGYRNAPPPLLLVQTHNTFVTGAAIAPDGRTAVTMSWDGEVRVCDAITGRTLRTFQHGQRSAYGFALSPDGRRLLTGSDDGTLRLWDLDGGREPRTLAKVKPAVSRIAFAPDGRRAATCGDNILRLWDLETGHLLRTFEERTAGNCIAFTGDGRSVVAAGPASAPRSLTLWDADTGRPTRCIGTLRSAVAACAVSADGRLVAGGGDEGDLAVWDLAAGASLSRTAGQGLPMRKLVFSPDGRSLFAGGKDPAISEWDVASGEKRRTIGRVAPVYDLSLPDAGDAMLSASGDGKVRLWPLTAGREARSLAGHKGHVRDLAVSPDRLTALSAGEDGTLREWDLATGLTLRVMARLPGTTVNAVRFLPDGTQALSTSGDGKLTLWDMASGRALQTRDVGRSALYLALAADGRTCVCSGPGGVQFWDIDGDHALRSIEDPGVLAGTHALAITSDGRTALTADNDWHVRAWDAPGGGRTDWPKLDGRVWGVDVSSDGSLAVSSTTALTIWRVADARPLRTIRGFTGDPRPVRFSPDARLVLTGTADGLVHLHAVADGQQVRAWRGHQGRVAAVAFAPDGRLALSAGDDQIIRAWDFTVADGYHPFEPRVAAAQRQLQKTPDDPVALATLGEWYAFRGSWSRGSKVLHAAREAGARVSSLSLARCEWMSGHLDAAEAEFQAAADAKEVPQAYAMRCLEAVRQQRPTATLPGMPSRRSRNDSTQ